MLALRCPHNVAAELCCTVHRARSSTAPRHKRVSAFTSTALFAVALVACAPGGDVLPVDGPRFPTGLAVTPDGNHLLVVSSNYDLAFADGALLVADLQKVRKETRNATAKTVVTGAYTASAFLPAFGDAPVVSTDGSRVWVPSRGENVLSSLDLTSAGVLSCGTGASTSPRCGVSPRVLALPQNDPFTMVLLSESTSAGGALLRAEGFITCLSSPDVFMFADDAGESGARRMQLTGAIHLGDGVLGVRSALVRPQNANADARAIAAVELDPAAAVVGALLVTFAPRGAADVRVFDVTGETGAQAVRDMVLVPGGPGENDALIVALRVPDALARFELDDSDGTPVPHLAGLAPTCRTPTSLAVVEPVPGQTRVLVTCQDSDAVEMVDPLTLVATDAVRFAGRGPYDVVVNAAVTPPEAYVSFFLDNSIGVLSVERDGAPHLTLRGRIGAATTRPEDGRE